MTAPWFAFGFKSLSEHVIKKVFFVNVALSFAPSPIHYHPSMGGIPTIQKWMAYDITIPTLEPIYYSIFSYINISLGPPKK